MSLKAQGFRYVVSPDRKLSKWAHPADMPKDWIDCTDMTDAQFDAFMGVK